MKRAARGKPEQPEGLWLNVKSIRSTYFISRSVSETSFSDDEASLEIVARIREVSSRHALHEGETLELMLLCAQRYDVKSNEGPTFFGAVTLRGHERSAVAYLPKAPFWSLPRTIEPNSTWIRLSFAKLRHGHGDLLDLLIGDETDRRNYPVG